MENQLVPASDPYNDPALLAAISSIEEAHALIDELVDLRKIRGISQLKLARIMNVSQSTISGFESESNDPRLSTLQRYARALGVNVAFKVENRTLLLNAYPTNWVKGSWTASDGELQFPGWSGRKGRNVG